VGLDPERSVKLGFRGSFRTDGFSTEVFFWFLVFSTEEREEVEDDDIFRPSSSSPDCTEVLGLELGGADLTFPVARDGEATLVFSPDPFLAGDTARLGSSFFSGFGAERALGLLRVPFPREPTSLMRPGDSRLPFFVSGVPPPPPPWDLDLGAGPSPGLIWEISFGAFSDVFWLRFFLLFSLSPELDGVFLGLTGLFFGFSGFSPLVCIQQDPELEFDISPPDWLMVSSPLDCWSASSFI
jgi:hypothetical protein